MTTHHMPITDSIHRRLSGGILHIEIVRPAALNALSPEVLTDLTHLFEWTSTVVGRAVVRAVVISGAGDRAFSAGADIKAMAAVPARDVGRIARLGQAAMASIEKSPVPVIAAVDGVALGGGCELVLACDIALATERSRFGQPEVHLGLIPCFGGCVRLPATIGRGRARRLILTGEIISASRAESWGLVTDVLPTDAALVEAVDELCRQIRSHPRNGIAHAKAALRDAASEQKRGLRAEREHFEECIRHEDASDGFAAFLERRTSAHE